MKGKGGVILLTVVISLLSLYHLSFTFVSNKIENEIEAYAEQQVAQAEEGTNVDSLRKAIKKSRKEELNTEEVYLGKTFEEVKKFRLNLGLDLQGGMHITLSVSPIDIIKVLANNSQDSAFVGAIEAARKQQRAAKVDIVDVFYQEYKKLSGNEPLNAVFLSPDNSAITSNTSDKELISLINKEVASAIDRVEQVLTLRLDKFGTTQPKIQKVGAIGRLDIELPGVDETDQERIVKQIEDVANLEFLEVLDPQEYFQYIGKINDYLVLKQKEAGTQEVKSTTEPAVTENALFDTENVEVATENAADADSLNATAQNESPILEYFQISQQGFIQADRNKREKINALLNSEEIVSILPDGVQILWGIPNKGAGLTEEEKRYVAMYFVKRGFGGEALLSGETVEEAQPTFDEMGRPAVSMQMNFDGTMKWAKITGDFAQQRKRIAIVLDNIVYSAPSVNTAIPNGSSIISGNFTIDEATDLSSILKAGKLPVPTQIEQMVIVGPSLGQAAIDRGLVSVIFGFVLTVVFMIAYYNKGGMIANLALFFNIFFILGIMSTPYLGVVLTLPGIAGIVLTIGMAVDANVIIFERIREELALGRSVKSAVDTGYKKAFWTIFDSNVTTVIVGIVLAVFGSGLVKGFAFTLIIGVCCSFFTSVYISRLFLEKMAEKGDKSLSFDTILSKNLFKNINFNFLAKKKLAYAISGVIIAVGIASIIIQGGLNLGVAFKGGYSYVVEFGQDVNASQIRENLKNSHVFEEADVDVKTFDKASQLQIATSYLIDSDKEDADSIVTASLLKGLRDQGLNPEIVQSAEVGASIAGDIKSTSLQSVFTALFAIFLYIVLRFRKWQFGAGAVVGLLHDVLIVISVFSIVRMLGISYEIDEVFIASILTVVGYSINDTVVVFDRIRERMEEKMEKNFSITVNTAINDTLSRTLVTSISTLLVVLVLFIFGGDALKGFSFALMIGIAVGAYSTIFIAASMAYDLSKKEANENEQ